MGGVINCRTPETSVKSGDDYVCPPWHICVVIYVVISREKNQIATALHLTQVYK